ncbi:MAG TPA: D-glycero-beta-D-manno-heptose 1,7-bisphosphate 7-phosphatase [Victivallales bacterium]|nr:D-glycero-beta-D-manno-heptose 1,7-bisphosphate 7-phosphatase [Victivallales bacterium]HPO90830.1 D-glycero-beta-D-manno-heptose 1,7-bisphosphate 7-phosphatase [Victivallales bacterium]HRR06196.1 D-glycero-beta-D-manno-heptose 1,7-bisphosphate 7-phosphatase [Victivallales bacterium]HRR28338.1 D-glycero-beta-D-manno-heptose 1,7-bisphosphate 7-phosphatase [Victivallales bacterium]HRU02043.1 D-glycero-beta-D-manno-heptose 1,7-bisphosphate 7-phosphatase [Victivallales bacterium]
MNKAVFLDRDNTIIFDKGYLSNPDEVKLISGVTPALKKLSEAGFLLIIVTNQSGIGRGYFSKEQMNLVNQKILQMLEKENIHIEKIYFCPHTPSENCECRKPKPGLILKAARELKIDISKSIMIGDKTSDLEAGIMAGCKYNIMINNSKDNPPKNAMVFQSLTQAADYIIANNQ